MGKAKSPLEAFWERPLRDLDALELDKLVKVSTPVIMKEGLGSPGARDTKNRGKAGSVESTADLRAGRSVAKRSGTPP